MGEPLPKLSAYVLLRSTLRMWLIALIANLIGAGITYGWLGARLRAVSGDVPAFDSMRWASASQISAQVAQYTPAMRAAYLPFNLADYIFAVMGATFLALTMGCLMRAAPNRFHETLALGHVFWLPVAMAAFDWAENAGFLYLVQSYPAEHPALAKATSLAKTGKSVALWATNLMVLAMAAVAIAHRVRRRRR